MAEIKGLKVDLSNGRSVFVGRRVSADFSTDESTYIQFTNGPTVNRIRLSARATEALWDLLQSKPVGGEPYSLEIHEAPGESVHWRWQVVTEKDA